MTQLNTYWTNLKMPEGTQKALYHQGKTVEEARGSLFCIARPTSNGEDNYAVITRCINSIIKFTFYKNYEIVVVDNVPNDD